MAETIRAGWRIKVGFTLFILSVGWPVFLPALSALGVSGALIATLTGVMLIAAEIMLVVGAAIAGKEGFAHIKQSLLGFLKSYAPPQQVSRVRYNLGLVVFSIPILLGWIWPYVGGYLPGAGTHSLAYAVGGDVMLLISLFILGGGFWDKLHSLFSHQAYSVFP